MVLSWTTKDALLQVEALLARKVVLEGNDLSKFPASKGPPNPYTASVAPLQAADVNASLKLLQSWLQKFVTVAEAHDVMEALMADAKRYESIERRTSEGKGDKPSTKDAAVTIDEKYDDSVTFFVLDTMTKVLSSTLHLDPSLHQQDLLPVEAPASQGSLQSTQPAVEFAFHYLHHSFVSPIRYGAAHLLGVLSTIFLGQAAEMFTEKYAAAKKDDQKREFSSYQQAVGYLRFSVGDMKKAIDTNTYLAELAKKMKDIDRGVLRQEICSSLNAIYSGILASPDPKRQLEWEKFASTGGAQYEAWNANYKEVYERVAKWSTKDKHALFCWELLLRMLVLTKSADFFTDKKRYDAFGAVAKGLSKKEFRPQCLVLMRNYVRDVPVQFLNADTATWAGQAKALMQALFGPKAPKPEDDEIPIMTDIFIEVGKKFTSYVITDVITDVLKPDSKYYTRQKSIALKALSVIARESKTNAADIMGLAPLLVPFIENARNSTDEKQIGLMKSALQCWPTIRGSPASAQLTAATILPLTLHEDREVSTLAVSSLQDFVQLDMRAYYLMTFHALIDQLMEVDPTQSIVILKLCNNLIVMLQTLQDYVTKPPPSTKPFAPEADAWVALREHMEAVALARLTHTEGWVRAEVLRVLLRMNAPVFAPFEKDVPSRSPRLVEALLPSVVDADSVPTSSEVFYVPLRRLITSPTSYTQFSGIIAGAWSYLYRTVDTLDKVDAGARMSDEWTALFRNELLFLCLTVRPGEGNGTSGNRLLERQGSARGSQSGEAAGPTQEQLMLRFQQKRDRVHVAKLQGGDVYAFYDTVINFLQSTNGSAYSNGLRATIAADLSLVDPTMHGELLKHLRAPLTATADPKAKKQPPNPRQAFYYHEYTLDLLARLLSRVNPDKYHAGVTVLTKTLDDLVVQWTSDSPDSYAALTALTRYYMASLITRYIFYRTVAKQNPHHTPKADVLNRRAFFFTRLVALLKGPAGDKDTQTHLESAVLSGVAAVIALGPMTDVVAGNNVLSFLEQQLSMQPPPHIHDGVTLCLQLFLRLNHHRVTDFIRFTLPEVHDPTSPLYLPHGAYNAHLRKKGEAPQTRATTAIISKYYAKCLSAGIAHDYTLWTTEYGLTSAEMLLVSLLLMNSADGEVRQAALILVQEILLKDAVTLPADARLFSPTSPFMYTPGTILLAQAIAVQPRYLPQVPAVLRRAVDVFAYLTEGKKEILLRLLHPFTAQFAPLVSGMDGQGKSIEEVMAVVDDVMDSLFAITRLCSTSGILGQSLKELWIAVLSAEPITPQLVGYVLSHLIHHYVALLNEGSGGAPATTVDRAHPPAARPSVLDATTVAAVKANTVEASTPGSSQRPSLSRTASVDGEDASKDKDATTKTPTKAPAPVAPSTPSSKTTAGVPEDALAIPDEVELEKPVRDVLLEKALLRMIATHLSRGGHAMLIINGLIEKLRAYPDTCPTDPQAFLQWFTDHHQPLAEPTTLIERSAFELIVNTIFERTQDELESAIPTLLLNAYVLFPGSQLSDELLKNISLALHMLDVKQLAEVVIGEQFFINNLSATHPALRASFSQTAFIWSINSRDNAIAGAAFRIFQELEAQSFYFGTGQSTLIRVIELIYACLKNKETRRLKSIIATCLLPTEQPYDQQGWSALLAASVALLSSQEVQIYQLGLQLFQHLFAYPIPVGRKKAWLVALGGLFDGNAAVESGAVELLFKGLTHPGTAEDTLAVLQTLSEYYSGTGSIPAKNRIDMAVQLMNVLLRGVDLNKIAEDKAKTGVQATEAQLATREKNRVSAASALSAMSTSLFESADSANGDDAEQFNALANVFKNVALSLALTLPDTAAPAGTEGEKGVKLTGEAARTALYAQLHALVETTGPLVVVGALDGVRVPALTQVLIPFFRAFTSVYDSQEHFDFAVSFFHRTLNRHVAEWRQVLLLMTGRFLLEAPYKVNIDAFVPLSESVAQSYYSSDKDEQHLAENLGYLLVQKRGTGQAKSSEVFNLIRTRASLRRPAASTTSLNLPEEKVDADSILNAALQRMQLTAFPSLQAMNAKAREVNRSDTPLSPRHLKVSPSPSVLLGNNNAADVAQDVATASDWHHLDQLLSAGVHGGTAVRLDAAVAKAAGDKTEKKDGEEEGAAKVSFASLIKVAEGSARVAKPKEEANPFAADETPAKKANPFGSDDEAVDEGKEEAHEPKEADAMEEAAVEKVNGHADDAAAGKEALQEPVKSEDGDSSNPFA